MTAHAEKVADKGNGSKTGATVGKALEKLGEKRRALGRGLESLLPGPRVVSVIEKTHSAPDEPGRVAGEASKGGVSPSVESAAASEPIASMAALSAIAREVPPLQSGPPVPIIVGDLHGQAETSLRNVDGSPILEISVDEIDQNPHQTRSTFTPGELQELADSIRVQGVIQPIVVRPATPPLRRGGKYGEGKELHYTLILGERRLRASQLAGRTTIPAVIRRVSEQQAAEMTLVENLQRQDLNCMDQAKAFRNLSENFQLTQEEIGKRVGVARETVANYMRLLRLPGAVQVFLNEGKLSYSHARMLLMIEDNDVLEKVAEKAVKDKLSVIKLDELITEMNFGAQGIENEDAGTKPGGARWVDPNVRAQQRNLESALGMKVRIRDRKGKGSIRIDYTSLDDFDRLVTLLKG